MKPTFIYRFNMVLDFIIKMIKKINPYNLLSKLLLSAGLIFGLSSCSEEPSDSPYVSSEAESTTLIYAVATNSLSSNFVGDTTEMVAAAPYIDLSKNNVLIFATTYKNDPQLLKLTKNGNKYNFKVIKNFSTDKSSLDPERISEVLDYVIDSHKADSYGLIFWSHSTGSQPYLQTETRSEENTGDNSVKLPGLYSFGQDINSTLGMTFQINIDELARVIPDNTFDYVWFDSCYMSNIESIFEFKNKCNYYIGYPTEVLEYGLPYDIVLPYIAKKNADVVTAADLFFKYYAENSYSGLRYATVAVTDMKKIDKLADICRSYFVAGYQPSATSFIKYTRGSSGPFYDLADYAKAMAKYKEMEFSKNEWDAVLDEVVIYKATTNYFLTLPISQEQYSGLSAHIYNFNDSSEKEAYYQSFDWFKSVF